MKVEGVGGEGGVQSASAAGITSDRDYKQRGEKVVQGGGKEKNDLSN